MEVILTFEVITSWNFKQMSKRVKYRQLMRRPRKMLRIQVACFSLKF